MKEINSLFSVSSVISFYLFQL